MAEELWMGMGKSGGTIPTKYIDHYPSNLW